MRSSTGEGPFLLHTFLLGQQKKSMTPPALAAKNFEQKTPKF